MSSGTLLAPVVATPVGPAPLRGVPGMRVVPDAALSWEDGLLTYCGPAAGLPPPLRESAELASGAVVPGFVDCHTHLPFFGWRAGEFAQRLAGVGYRDLHGEGGIGRSARMLSDAADEAVLRFSRSLAVEMLAHGTTALELKTGYGLSVGGELRQARLARRLAAELPQATTVTLLACHAVPPRRSRESWVEEVRTELIPRAAEEGLADAVDVYVEDIAFTVDDLRVVGEAARGHGLALRCHAEQLGPTGAAETAAGLGARNVDHLNHLTVDGARALGGAAGTAAVLLPVADLVMGVPLPPVRELAEAGAALALATDLNPGTAPCLSLPEAVALGACLYRLEPLACVAAATLNAAWALGLDDRLGSLEPGRRADFVVLDTDDPAMVAYRPGHNPVVETWVGGRRVHRREG